MVASTAPTPICTAIFQGFGAVDVSAHTSAAPITARPPLGQSVVIQNQPAIAMTTAARIKVDATTKLLVLLT